MRIGLRRGDVLGLRWQEVDLEAGVLTVRQTLQRVGGELFIGLPKTQQSARRVALPAECLTALRARRAEQQDSLIRVTMDIYTFVRLDSQRSAFDRVGDALRDINEGDDADGASGVPARV
ncbi:hypothetical protein ABZ686_07870 [Streptomyces sp. NPDC006992]|uniref:hypothetical protein n=1 Tax=Streptomyces sp. NPDC006992 TaxID=3155601 RepID=UPI0033D9F7C6